MQRPGSEGVYIWVGTNFEKEVHQTFNTLTLNEQVTFIRYSYLATAVEDWQSYFLQR